MNLIKKIKKFFKVKYELWKGDKIHIILKDNELIFEVLKDFSFRGIVNGKVIQKMCSDKVIELKEVRKFGGN